jgi:hypothetical protein
MVDKRLSCLHGACHRVMRLHGVEGSMLFDGKGSPEKPP